MTAAVRERRILLTRDRQLLKHGAVTHGYWVRSTDPIVQAREILRRFDLVGQADPYARCLACNGVVREVDKQKVIEEIPPKTARWLDTYRQCSRCGKLTWRGTHFARIEETVARILDEPS